MRSSSRRSSSRRRRPIRSFQDLKYRLASAGIGRLVKWGVIGLVALYMLLRLFFFFVGTLGYADVMLNDDRAAVQYSVGLPERVRRPGEDWSVATPADASAPGGGEWSYPTAAGGRINVRFDSGGRVDRVGCVQAEAQPFSCPSMFAADLGMQEKTLYRTFGKPSREQIGAGSKIAFYDDIGVVYSLSRFRVYKMELRRERGNILMVFGRFLRDLVP